MTLKTSFRLAFLIVFGSILFGSGYFVRGKIDKVRTIEKNIYIKGETKLKWRYLKYPKTFNQYKKAYSQQIGITGYMDKKNIFRVKCSDTYKSSEKGFRMGSRAGIRFYLTVGLIGAGVGAATGYGIYRLVKKLK